MAAVNDEGLSLLKLFEGLSLDAYADIVGVHTIGYGHTAGVQPGDTITGAQAENLLHSDLDTFSGGVARLVKVSVSDNEFSALVSLAYNIGLDNFQKSTTLKRLNAGDHLGAADAIDLWNKGRVNGKLVVLPGLVRRRAAERALFLKPEGAAGQSDAIELNTRLPPSRERGSLSDSRTVQGAIVAGGAGAVAAAGAASQSAVIENPAAGSGAAPAPTAPATTPDTAHPPSATPAPAPAGTTLPGYVQHTAKVFNEYPEIYLAAAVLIVLAAAWILWARVDDWNYARR